MLYGCVMSWIGYYTDIMVKSLVNKLGNAITLDNLKIDKKGLNVYFK